MSLYQKQKSQYVNKFNRAKDKMAHINLDMMKKVYKYDKSDDDIKKDIETNAEDFNKFVFEVANVISNNTGTSCTPVAAVISYLCDKYDVDHKVMIGLCMDKTGSNYEKELEIAKSSEGSEPMMANHVYVELGNGEILEYFKGIDNKNIDHVQVEEML